MPTYVHLEYNHKIKAIPLPPTIFHSKHHSHPTQSPLHLYPFLYLPLYQPLLSFRKFLQLNFTRYITFSELTFYKIWKYIFLGL